MKNQNQLSVIRQGVASFIMGATLFVFAQASVLGQNVGIGTTTPDPSALHIDAKGKGVLFPSTYLDSETDDSNVPKPATNLLVFNTSNSLGSGAGLYYNAGTPALPNWTPTFGLKLPYFNSLNSPTVNFTVENYETSTASGAIRGFSSASTGVHGESVVGVGVLARNLSGLGGAALEVDGKMKIAGTGHLPAVGKVLTSDASGNATWEGAVAFAVNGIKDGSFQIPRQTNTKVEFKSVEYDLGGNYDGTNSTFKVPTTGIYHLESVISWLPTAFPVPEKNFRAMVNIDRTRNGSTKTILHEDATVEMLQDPDFPAQSFNLSIDCLLQKDDQIHVWVYYNSDEPFLYLGTPESYTRFSGRLVIKQ
ncbi:hypothetical protein [Dyadobacter arcticus]|uniref:C1q domain-containing protein n=1 Tax=Dyadobacter arcticus TaxID=1078754 RepID=A0ABX0UHH0_9BACT|nr:hypothetical protein [Dyadobacter arcticus]NIJ51494.1 hypothetical protein [Dyadobacter arcticus]